MRLSDWLPGGQEIRDIQTGDILQPYTPPKYTVGGVLSGAVSRAKDFFLQKLSAPLLSPVAEPPRILSASLPSPTVTPTSTPTPTPVPFNFNFQPHIGPQTKRTIYAPPKEDLPLYREFFPKEATSAAVAAFNESMYDPSAENRNKKGSLDRGYFQINEETFKFLKTWYPNTLKKLGVKTYDDVWDKRKNFAVAKLIRDKMETRAGKKAWTSWFGWQDQGFQNVGNPDIDYSK